MPKDLLAGGIARLFRRPLNRWLGGFGADAASDEEALEAVLKSLASDHKLFRWRGRTVEVTGNVDAAKVDLRYLQRGDFIDMKNVPIAELTEIEDMIDQDFLFMATQVIDDPTLRKEVAESTHLGFKSIPNKTYVPAVDITATLPVSSDVFKVLFRDPADSPRKCVVPTKCC
jgi:hypothetical protein